jgi:Lon protease-like protein
MINLPQFPLQLVAFPREVVPLHIFEQRYKDLVKDCVNNNTTFGILPFIDGRLADHGTEVSILEVSNEYDNGSMDIRCLGRRIYRVEHFIPVEAQEGYSSAEVIFLESNEEAETSTRSKMYDSLQKMMDILGDRYKLNVEVPGLHSSQFIHKLGLDLERELKLLTTFDEDIRQLKLIDIVDHIVQQMNQADEIRKRIQMNGHFKKLGPLEL